MNSKHLARQICSYVHDTTARAIERYLPDLRIPGFFAGHRIVQEFAVDLCVVLTFLRKAGYTAIGPRPIEAAIQATLAQLDGQQIKIFYSYRLSEILLAFGGMRNNPLLDGLSSDQIRQLEIATDSTSIYDPSRKALHGYPNNFWCVLARCEHARSKLGQVKDDSIYQEALGRARELLFRNPLGFFDDDVALSGRYDIYTADVMLFVEPMWDLLGRERIIELLAEHVRLLEAIAMPNGGSICWGRSIASLSVCMTGELAVAGLHNGVGNAGRLLQLASNAFEHFKSDWMYDDLINAHRGRMTDWYRGPERLLQSTFDCLEKWMWTALKLLELDHESGALTRRELFPARDDVIRFESRPACVWMYRDRMMELQLPIISGKTSDYVTAPHAPGLFDTPVDSPILIGVPRCIVDGKEYAPCGLPLDVTHSPGQLKLVRQPLKLIPPKDARGDNQGDDAIPATIGFRDASWRVDNGSLVIDESWTFDRSPQAISYAWAESSVPLSVTWSTNRPHSITTIDVDGVHGFRTAWASLRRLHQIDLAPSPEAPVVSLRATITPAIKVAHGPATQDYNRGMYDRMPAGRVIEVPFEGAVPVDKLDDFIDRIEQAGIFHLGWPEHLLAGAFSRSELIKAHGRLINEIQKRGMKIVWTMHNRRPHVWPAEEGRALYRLWAGAADAALHHSKWGKSAMTGDYSFRPDCSEFWGDINRKSRLR